MALIYNSLLLCGIVSCILTSIPLADSFGIQLIRRDTIDTSLFPKNLTLEERHKKFADLSFDRVHYLRSIATNSMNSLNKNTAKLGPDDIRPPMFSALNSIFIVSLSIGSPPFNTYLALDTGSEFTWVQSKACTDCFQLKGGGFDDTISDTFQALPWNHPLCEPGQQQGSGICNYDIEYVGCSSRGIVGLETFTFKTTTDTLESIPNLVLGCATSTPAMSFRDNDGPNNEIAGLFGLGTGPRAFITKTASLTHNRFSYCFPPWNEHPGTHTFLYFGNDIPPPTQEQRNLLQRTQMIVDGYYLVLMEIYFGNGKARFPLGIDSSKYMVKPDRSGGFSIDTGSSHTMLYHDAYELVKDAYLFYFYLFHIGRENTSGSTIPYDLCYKWPVHVKELPALTFRFLGGAYLEVNFWNVFQLVYNNLMCMAILPINDAGPSVLGAVQQADYRFVYDNNERNLIFYPEKCNPQ